MRATLGLFPLHLVVFPNEKLNLHIFEPRYKQLINECYEEGATFGIVPFINKTMMMYGTQIKVESIEKVYPNGEMDIRSKGIDLFKVDEVFNPFPGKLYIGGAIQNLDNNINGNYVKSEEIIERVELLFDLLAIPKDPPTNSATFVTYDIAHHIGFTLEQEYEFFLIHTEEERQDYVLKHLEEMVPRVKKINSIRERAMLNGHFRNIIPPI